MMLPDALHGWAPSFGQWCSFAISSLRWTGSTYLFRGRFNSVEAIAVRLELLHRFSGEFRGGEDGDVVLLPRPENGFHPRSPLTIAEDVVVQDQGSHVGRPYNPEQMGQGPFRVFLRIMLRHVGHRTVDVQHRGLRVQQEGEVFLQRRAEHVGRVDEHFVAVGDARHHDVSEFVVVSMRQGGREEEFRPAEVHLVSIRDLNFLRIFLERPDERARPLPLAPVDMELAVLQEGELAAEDRGRIRIVVIVMVVGDRQDVRVLRRGSDALPQFLLAGLLRRMRAEVVAVRTEAHAWVDEHGHVRCLHEGRHGACPEAVGRERRDLHRNTASPHTWRFTFRKPSDGNREREATLSTKAWRVGRFPTFCSSRETADTTERARPFRRCSSRTWTMPMIPTRSVIVWVRAHATG